MTESLYDQMLGICIKYQMRDDIDKNIPNCIISDYDKKRMNFLYVDLIEGNPLQDYTHPESLIPRISVNQIP